MFNTFPTDNHNGPYCHQNTSCIIMLSFCRLSGINCGILIQSNIQVLKKNMAMLCSDTAAKGMQNIGKYVTIRIHMYNIHVSCLMFCLYSVIRFRHSVNMCIHMQLLIKHNIIHLTQVSPLDVTSLVKTLTNSLDMSLSQLIQRPILHVVKLLDLTKGTENDCFQASFLLTLIHLPSRELKYPTFSKRKIIFKSDF